MFERDIKKMKCYDSVENFAVPAKSEMADIDIEAREPRILSCKSLSVLFFTALFVMGISYNISAVKVMHNWGSILMKRSTSRRSTSIVLSVENEYSSKNYSMFPYPFLEGALLLEPYRESTVILSGADSECSYTWSMETVGSTVHSWQGKVDLDSMSFTVDPYPKSTGEYEISIAGAITSVYKIIFFGGYIFHLYKLLFFVILFRFGYRMSRREVRRR